nr:RNA-dependent RNA polymerase [Erysiphe necator associated negative-stranded RNA virus 11]
MMSKETFISDRFHYWRTIQMRYSFDDTTIPMTFLRTTNESNYDTHSNEVVISPDKMYIPMRYLEEDYTDETIYELFFEMKTGVFTCPPEPLYVFSPLEWRLAQKFAKSDERIKMYEENMKNSTESFRMDSILYLKMLNEIDRKEMSKLELKYHPIMAEMENYKEALDRGYTLMSPMGELTKMNLMNKIQKSEESHTHMNMLFQDEYMRRNEWDHDDDNFDLDTIVSRVTEWKTNELSLKKMKMWNKTRHNIFGMEVLRAMSWEVPEKFDQSMAEIFNYEGPEDRKTPDYYLIEADRIVLFDFAVTTGDPGDVADKKTKKYEELRENLARHLKKQVEFYPIVWKINSNKYFWMPDFMQNSRASLKKSEKLEILKTLYQKISNMENYDKFRLMTEEMGMTEKELDDKILLYDKLIDSVTQMYNFKDKKTCSITKVRENNWNFNNMKVNYKDDPIYKKMEDLKMIDEDQYLEYTADMIADSYKKKNLPKYLKQTLDFDKDRMLSMIKTEKEKQEEVRRNHNKNPIMKNPTIFKYPNMKFFGNYMKETETSNPFYFWRHTEELADGTVYLDVTPHMDELAAEKEKMQMKEEFYERAGLGSDETEDSSLIEAISRSMQNMMDDMALEDMQKYDKELNKEEKLRPLLWSELWNTLSFYTDMMENICYLDGRRHLRKSDGGKGSTVMKNFDRYTMLIKKGSKLTAEKQIRVKIIAHKNDILNDENRAFKKWREMPEDPEYWMTKWLTVSATDIKHFVKIKWTAVGMYSDMIDRNLENKKDTVMNTDEEEYLSMLTDRNMYMFLIMLEHKRGTSTSSQLNRYLMHSATAYLTNRDKLIKEVFSGATRSILESDLKMKQINWYKLMLDRMPSISHDKIKNLMSTDSGYDRLMLPSFFDVSEDIEFSEMMNEIYVCNLFEKESGFADHRSKGIVEKMMAAEIHYRDVKEKDWSKGKIEDMPEFFKSEDELHFFDEKFVYSASKKYFKDKTNKLKFRKAMADALTFTVNNAMMMTSSLTGGPFKSEVLRFNNKIQKSKSFLTLFEAVEECSSNLLCALISRDEIIDAIFALFPKAQIGGHREILIQSVKLRIMVKMLETISRKFCDEHEKEMLTKNDKKARIQSDKMSEYKELMMALKSRKKDSLFFSFNSDATRWSPGFVMENFMTFVAGWDLNDDMMDFMQTTIMSFSEKKMLTPDNLVKKWEKKPGDQKESSDAIEMYRQETMSNSGYVIIESGMGQGMFHYLSSIYHCIMDDAVDYCITQNLWKVYRAKIRGSTMISSDDKTKINMILMTETKYANEILDLYIVTIDLAYRLSNIHTNWKKSGLSFVITEFNSLFSIGKRMCWASLKDIYTANSLPDLTAPEEAVKFIMSNMRRCLEHGVYLSTIKIMMLCSRLQLIRYYRMNESLIQHLMGQLDCKEEDLPFQLGFVPLKFPVETLIYGPELHMYNPENSMETRKFYSNLYTANTSEYTKLSKGVVPFTEDYSGKFWLELPSRLDQKIKDIKKDFFNDKLKEKPDEIMARVDKYSLNIHSPIQDFTNYKNYSSTYFIGMNRKYEFQETVVVHSLIRSLQLSRERAMIYPLSKEMRDAESEFLELSKKRDLSEIEDSRLDELTMIRERKYSDLPSFVNFILNRVNKNSSQFFLDGLTKVYKEALDNSKKIKNLSKVVKNFHPTMRTLRFYSSSVGLDSSVNDLINYMFNTSFDPKNSTIKSFNNLKNMMGNNTPIEEIIKQPFRFVMNLFKDEEFPLKRFKDFLSYYNKNLRFIKINMLSDRPCTGSAKNNIMNMYCTRSHSYYSYEDKSRQMMEETDIKFLTEVSTRSKEYTNMESNDYTIDDLIINEDDRNITRSAKLYNLCYGRPCKVNQMESRRIEYRNYKRKNYELTIMTDFVFFVRIKTHKKSFLKKNKVVELYRFTNRYSNVSMALINELKRETMEDEYTSVLWKTNSEFSDQFDVAYDFAPLSNMVGIVKYSNLYWIFKLKVNIQKVKDEDGLEFTFLRDHYTMHKDAMMNMKFKNPWDTEKWTLKDMMAADMNLDQLNTVFRENNMFQEDFLKLSTERSVMTENEKEEELSNYYSMMGNFNLKESLTDFFGIAEKFSTDVASLDATMGMDETYNSSENIEKDFKFANLPMLFDKMSDAPSETESEDTNVDKRTSLLTCFDKMINDAFKISLQLKKEDMKRFYRYCLNTDKMQNFHNFLIWNIKDIYKDDISDTLTILVYNMVLKNSTFLGVVNPSQKVTLKKPPNIEMARKTAVIEKYSEKNRMEMMNVMDMF